MAYRPRIKTYPLPGNSIIDWRAKHGYSQAKLAALLGISAPLLCEWERGRKKPSYYLLWALSYLGQMPHGGDLHKESQP